MNAIKLSILLNVAFWTLIAMASFYNNIINSDGYYLVSVLFVVEAIVYAVCYQLIKLKIRIGYYALVILSSSTALLSIVDEVGWGDILSLLLSLLMVVSLFRYLHSYHEKKALD